MKISKKTINILKNFSTIQQGIVIKANTDKLVTVSETGSVLANSPIEETFPFDIPIYNLGELLNCISVFSDPEFTINEQSMVISETDGASETKYIYSNERLISQSPSSELNFENEIAEVVISDDIMKKVIKSANIMKLTKLRIISDGTSIRLEAFDPEIKNTYSEILDREYNGPVFDDHLLVSSLKMLSDDYTLSVYHVADNGMMVNKFTGTGDTPIRYWLASETSSKMPV